MRRFPAAFDELPPQKRQSATGERWTTWAVNLLPDMELGSTFDQFALGNVPLPQLYVSTYLCPSDSGKSREGNVCSYVANGGVNGSAKDQKPANGAFLNRIFSSKAAVMDGHWKDGRDHTLAFSERSDCGPYSEFGWSGLNTNPNDPNSDHLDHEMVDNGRDRAWGPVFVWHANPLKCAYINADPCFICVGNPQEKCTLVTGTGRYIGRGCTVDCSDQVRAPNAKPSSEHGGGVNAVFGSGRGLFIRETIDYGVWRALMTLSEKQSDSPDRNKVLDDTAFE